MLYKEDNPPFTPDLTLTDFMFSFSSFFHIDHSLELLSESAENITYSQMILRV